MDEITTPNRGTGSYYFNEFPDGSKVFFRFDRRSVEKIESIPFGHSENRYNSVVEYRMTRFAGDIDLLPKGFTIILPDTWHEVYTNAIHFFLGSMSKETLKSNYPFPER